MRQMRQIRQERDTKARGARHELGTRKHAPPNQDSSSKLASRMWRENIFKKEGEGYDEREKINVEDYEFMIS
jgi:uncharacterized protein YozE (UPF0346 family)